MHACIHGSSHFGSSSLKAVAWGHGVCLCLWGPLLFFLFGVGVLFVGAFSRGACFPLATDLGSLSRARYVGAWNPASFGLGTCASPPHATRKKVFWRCRWPRLPPAARSRRRLLGLPPRAGLFLPARTVGATVPAPRRHLGVWRVRVLRPLFPPPLRPVRRRHRPPGALSLPCPPGSSPAPAPSRGTRPGAAGPR